MKHVLVALAVALFLLPVGASADNFPAQIDGSWDTYDTEGVGNAGGSSSFRLNKGNQHFGYMDFGNAPGLAAFVAANPGFEAFLWVKSVGGLGNKAGIVTLRTGNVGDIVEDYGLNAADPTGDMTGIPGTSQPSAWRMADTYIAGPPPSYVNLGDGISQQGAGTFPGEAWRRPSTGDPAGTSSGGFTFTPGSLCQRPAGPFFTGFWGGEIYGVEAAMGGTWSQGSNTVALFEKAGQLVNKKPDNTFLFLDPATDAQADGWYKVSLNQAIVLDMINNVENKGIVFSSYVAGASITWGAPAFGNDLVYSSEHQGGIYAPYLEITPEPATMVLLALGGLVALRRRSA